MYLKTATWVMSMQHGFGVVPTGKSLVAAVVSYGQRQGRYGVVAVVASRRVKQSACSHDWKKRVVTPLTRILAME